MSLWTPSGEHPVGDQRGTQPGGEPLRTGRGGAAPGAPSSTGGGPGRGGPETGGPEAGGPPFGGDGAELDALRRQLADAPPEVVVANHCYGLFELAAVYLSQSPPRLDEARFAIDALGCLVDGLGDRLGETHASLRDALAQIRLAFVQIGQTAAVPSGDGVPASSDDPGSG